MNTKNLLYIFVLVAAVVLIGPYFGFKSTNTKQEKQKDRHPVKTEVKINIKDTQIKRNKSIDQPSLQGDSLSDIEEMLK